MLKKSFHIVLVACLSVLLVFGSTAKEFVHLFAQHEDTTHRHEHVCPPGEAHFEQEHHHCSFLHFVLEPFANDAFVPRIICFTNDFQTAKNSLAQAKFIPRSVDQICLRGPPAKLV